MEEHLEEEKVAVISGGNSGIGFSLAQRLVKIYPSIQLCLACRNEVRANKAAEDLRHLSPTANISVVILDTSSVQSVHAAASQLRAKYTHIDLLYLNAGMMVISGLDLDYIAKSFFSTRLFHMFATGEGALKHDDWLTDDGLRAVFQTNLFGHYILLKELESSLGNTATSDKYSQIIWTSSGAAQEAHFSMDDIQHTKCKNPYSSSKYATDMVSIGLNERLNKQGIYSHTMCPGLVESNMTYGIMPTWFWKLLLPLILLVRLVVPSLTTSTFNGSEALVWLSNQRPQSLDPQTKFRSQATVFGKAYVSEEKMKIDPGDAEKLLLKLDKLEREVSSNSKGR